MATVEGRAGNVVDVDDDGRMLTAAVNRGISESANIDGRVFAIQFQVTPLAAGDFFFFFQNLDTRDVIIKTWRETSSIVTKVTMELVTGTPTFVAEADANITNRNASVTSSLLALAKFDTDITTLISGGELAFHGHGVANQLETLRLESGVVVSQGKAIALKQVVGAGLMDVLLTIEVQE